MSVDCYRCKTLFIANLREKTITENNSHGPFEQNFSGHFEPFLLVRQARARRASK